MTNIVMLDSAERVDRSLVGGKSAGLMRMMQGNVQVPPGFVVTTDAYSQFLTENGLSELIAKLIGDVDYGRAEQVESATEQVRALIEQAPFPVHVLNEITKAYESVGTDVHVAVRSSGTQEDMGDASFAGLYDTYLDIIGTESVIDAVRRCWASLWTARCASYRERLGISVEEATVAVVVQMMVRADAAGVLFTANPFAERTDQMIVNANYGLGESIAQGIVTPDEFTVNAYNYGIESRILGSKEVQIVRSPDGRGVVHESVATELRDVYSLNDRQVSDLCRIGRRVLDLANEVPQDIEWALQDGTFYLLQSRDITGATFLWEEAIDAWQTDPDLTDETWSHTWAKAYWTGAVSPMFYSIRGLELRNSDKRLFTLWGWNELVNRRRFKFRRSTVYFSSDADRIYYQLALPVRLRKHSLSNLPPDWYPDAAGARFSWYRLVKMHLRIRFLTKDQGIFRSFNGVRTFFATNSPIAAKPSPEELRTYTDEAVRAELEKKVKMFEDYFVVLRPAFHIYSATAFALLREMIDSWYDGENSYAFQDLISGLPARTAMMQESQDTWELANRVAQSGELRELLFKSDSGEAFFSACGESDTGRDFLRHYENYLSEHGHRGHQDRDFYFPRRCEDPQIDFLAMRALVTAESSSPEVNEHKLIEKRLESTAEVLKSIRHSRFGFIKAKAFTAVLNYVHRFLVLRDDERPFADLVTMSKKRAVVEMGQRLHERGDLEHAQDVLYLAKDELYEFWDNKANSKLVELKIQGRRHVFEKFLAREEIPTDYLHGNTPLFIDDGSGGDGSGRFQGVGMSRGSVTGTARIIRDLREMEKVQKGEILICNSTDPGWTPVFGLISGLVLESGGMLSHGACLSREYGLPAVNLPNAMQKVPDGATVTVNGDTGMLIVHDQEMDQSEDAPSAE